MGLSEAVSCGDAPLKQSEGKGAVGPAAIPLNPHWHCHFGGGLLYPSERIHGYLGDKELVAAS